MQEKAFDNWGKIRAILRIEYKPSTYKLFLKKQETWSLPGNRILYGNFRKEKFKRDLYS